MLPDLSKGGGGIIVLEDLEFRGVDGRRDVAASANVLPELHPEASQRRDHTVPAPANIGVKTAEIPAIRVS